MYWKLIRNVITNLAQILFTLFTNLLSDICFLDILDKVVSGSQKAEQVKKAIWKFDLLQSVLIALKQDFSQIQGKWKTASSLTKILA